MNIIFPLLVILTVVNERVQTGEAVSLGLVGIATIGFIQLLYELQEKVFK